MSYGGLRGAVGLALAIAVKATPMFSPAFGERFVFHIGGMALLTLVINGTFSAPVLRKLGLLERSDGQKMAMEDGKLMVAKKIMQQYEKLAKMSMYQDHQSTEVKTVLEGAVQEVKKVALGYNDPNKVNNNLVIHIRKVFLQVVLAEYNDMLHHEEIPQENANELINCGTAALDDADTCISSWTRLMDNFAKSNRYESSVFMRSPHDKKLHQLEMTYFFLEAHDRAKTKVFELFGNEADADILEEKVVDNEIIEMKATATSFLNNELGIGRAERAEVSNRMLLSYINATVKKEIAKIGDVGLVSPQEGSELVELFEDAMSKVGVERSGAISKTLSVKLSSASKKFDAEEKSPLMAPESEV